MLANEEKNSLIRSLLNNALKEIMSSLNAECGSLFICDIDKNELVLDSFHNSKHLMLKGLKLKIGDGIAGRVVNMENPVLVKNIDKDTRFKKNGFKHYRTNSFISIPLYTPKRLLGLINVADKKSGEPFSENDLRLVGAISRCTCKVVDTLNEHSKSMKKYASMGRLAAGIVHEINGPLDGILRYTNLLIKRADCGTPARENLNEIKCGLSRITAITKSLLEFSSRINHDSRDNKNYADVHSIIDESISSLNGQLSPGLKISKKYITGPMYVLNMGLEHVFRNIIKNASDATSGGGWLKITSRKNDLGIEICFRDNGPGIPKELQENIFMPFFTTKNQDQGTGLGLPICREIIHNYDGGDISVKSSPGKGSTFIISIPGKYVKNE